MQIIVLRQNVDRILWNFHQVSNQFAFQSVHSELLHFHQLVVLCNASVQSGLQSDLSSVLLPVSFH